jgi:hypothetical protein
METDFTGFTKPKGGELREIDKLKDIREVTVKTDLPTEQRTADFIAQIGNPYEYMCGNVKVKCEFGGDKSLENYFDEIVKS